MTEEEAVKFIKEEFAKFTIKYPKLTVNLQGYIKNHYNQNKALGECVAKLAELDNYVNFLFFEELGKKV